MPITPRSRNDIFPSGKPFVEAGGAQSGRAAKGRGAKDRATKGRAGERGGGAAPVSAPTAATKESPGESPNEKQEKSEAKEKEPLPGENLSGGIRGWLSRLGSLFPAVVLMPLFDLSDRVKLRLRGNESASFSQRPGHERRREKRTPNLSMPACVLSAKGRMDAFVSHQRRARRPPPLDAGTRVKDQSASAPRSLHHR